MAIAPQFKHFVDEELARSAELLDRIAMGTLEQLRQPTVGMLSPAEKQQYLELMELLRTRHGLLRDGFVGTLQQLVRSDLEERGSLRPADPFGDLGSSGTLTLMDESQVQADIEISRAAALIDSTAEWELRELQSFTSTLNGQTHVSPESNPFRPLFYARALWHGACTVTSAPVQRALFLRTAAGVASGLLKKAWAAASTRIENMGVTPGMYRTVVLTPSAVVGRLPSGSVPPAETNSSAQAPATLGRVRDRMSAALAKSAAQSAAPADAPALFPRLGFNPGPEFESALLRLEDLLRQLPAGGAHPTALRSDLAAPRLRDHLSALTAATQDATDHQIIELLARFFDYVLSDTQVHPACRPLIAKLQASALQVALEDPAVMQDHRHEVWRLMDRLGSAFALYGQAGDPRLSALFEFSDDLVQSLAGADDQDAVLYRRGLSQLDAFLQTRRQAELQAAQSHVDQLVLAEKRDHLEQQISQRLVDQLVPMRVSPGIRRFITGDWARVLAHSYLRHGEQAETTVAYMKAVDDLLWSLNLPDHPQSRQRLLGLLPNLLHRLRAGMSLIDLPETEQQNVLDELMTVHTEALRPGHKGSGGLSGMAPTAAATPEQIVQMLRDEPEPTTQMGPSFADSLIDLQSMDTVPAELIETHPPGETDDFASPVDGMQPGDATRLFLKGRWTRVLLLWRSQRGAYFLFAGESPGRTHSVTEAALERLSGEKLLLPLEERTLSQRALQALIKDLS